MANVYGGFEWFSGVPENRATADRPDARTLGSEGLFTDPRTAQQSLVTIPYDHGLRAAKAQQ